MRDGGGGLLVLFDNADPGAGRIPPESSDVGELRIGCSMLPGDAGSPSPVKAEFSAQHI